MIDVKYVKLAELCSVNQGLQIPISKRFKTIGVNRYFYITVQFLKDSHNEKYYVENPPKSSICNENDIIVVRTGSTGKILTGIKGCFHNNFFKVNYNKEKVVGKYLFYCLGSKEKQKEMKNRSGITTIPDLNHFMFLDMKIPLPSYSNQKGIVKVLDSINNKIEINNKINQELEAMAKTLYDYWFVQFDFPAPSSGSGQAGKPYKSSGGKMIFNEALKREIPEGWEVKSIGNYCKSTGGFAFKSNLWADEGAAVVKIKDIQEDYTIDLSNISHANLANLDVDDKFAAKPGDVLIAMTGATIGKYAIVPFTKNPLYVNQRVGYFDLGEVPTKKLPFLINSLNQKYFREVVFRIATGAAQPNISNEQINNIELITPNAELLNKYNKKMKSSYDIILNNQQENQKLSELRDWLLPMLMNGQITVGGAKAEIKNLGLVAEGDVKYGNKV